MANALPATSNPLLEAVDLYVREIEFEIVDVLQTYGVLPHLREALKILGQARPSLSDHDYEQGLIRLDGLINESLTLVVMARHGADGDANDHS